MREENSLMRLRLIDEFLDAESKAEAIRNQRIPMNSPANAQPMNMKKGLFDGAGFPPLPSE